METEKRIIEIDNSNYVQWTGPGWYGAKMTSNRYEPEEYGFFRVGGKELDVDEANWQARHIHGLSSVEWKNEGDFDNNK